MKNYHKTIGLLMSGILILNLSAPLSVKAAEEELTKPQIECASKLPDYTLLLSAWMALPEGKKDTGAYDDAFEAAQTQHHDYVGCMFEFAEKTILKNDGADTGGTYEAHTPNFDAFDWMAPDQACLTTTDLRNAIKDSDPGQMIAPVLNAHKLYVAHLAELSADYEKNGIVTVEVKSKSGNPKTERIIGINHLIAKGAAMGKMKRQTQMESESALVAIDMMFSSLKELRISFLMHVHFQCTLKFLEKYRKALEKLRNEIEPLPNLLRDASISS